MYLWHIQFLFNKQAFWKLFPSLFFTDHQDPSERPGLWTFPVLQSVPLCPSLCTVWLVPWQMCKIGEMPQWSMDSRDLSSYNLWGRNLWQLSVCFLVDINPTNEKKSKIQFTHLSKRNQPKHHLPPRFFFRTALGHVPWVLHLKCLLHTHWDVLLAQWPSFSAVWISSPFSHTGTSSLLTPPFSWVLTTYFICQVPRCDPLPYTEISSWSNPEVYAVPSKLEIIAMLGQTDQVSSCLTPEMVALSHHRWD